MRQALFNRRMLICVFTGFSSGLPLYMLINLLPAWLRSEGVDLTAIGLFALVRFPFTWKFLWAPFVDRYALPLLGRRRGWMLATQLLLLLSIPLFGALAPQLDLWTIAYLAAAVAFFAATQDIVLDAYRRELLPDAELGLGNAIHVQAYRISSLVPGRARPGPRRSFSVADGFHRNRAVHAARHRQHAARQRARANARRAADAR